jgi:hypothetical protein
MRSVSRTCHGLRRGLRTRLRGSRRAPDQGIPDAWHLSALVRARAVVVRTRPTPSGRATRSTRTWAIPVCLPAPVRYGFLRGSAPTRVSGHRRRDRRGTRRRAPGVLGRPHLGDPVGRRNGCALGIISSPAPRRSSPVCESRPRARRGGPGPPPASRDRRGCSPDRSARRRAARALPAAAGRGRS